MDSSSGIYVFVHHIAAAVGIIDVRLVPILIQKLKTELDEIKVILSNILICIKGRGFNGGRWKGKIKSPVISCKCVSIGDMLYLLLLTNIRCEVGNQSVWFCQMHDVLLLLLTSGCVCRCIEMFVLY
jgi:hypothetical protein